MGSAFCIRGVSLSNSRGEMILFMGSAFCLWVVSLVNSTYSSSNYRARGEVRGKKNRYEGREDNK